MEASFADLWKNSGEIIRALSRNEQVTVFYRGTPTAVMVPIQGERLQKMARAAEHPAFGMWADRDQLQDVAAHVRGLRTGRRKSVKTQA